MARRRQMEQDTDYEEVADCLAMFIKMYPELVKEIPNGETAQDFIDAVRRGNCVDSELAEFMDVALDLDKEASDEFEEEMADLATFVSLLQQKDAEQGRRVAQEVTTSTPAEEAEHASDLLPVGGLA